MKHVIYKKILSIILTTILGITSIPPVRAQEFLAVPGQREFIFSNYEKELRSDCYKKKDSAKRKYPPLPLERIVGLISLGGTRPGDIYIGIVLQAENQKMYVLSIGHAARVGVKVRGYLGNIELEGEFVACIEDDKGRDSSLIKMYNISSDIKFAPLPIGYPPNRGWFEADIAFVNFDEMGRHIFLDLVSDHIESVSVPALYLESKEVGVYILRIYAEDNRLKQHGTSGSPIFYEGKDGNLRLVGMLFGISKKSPYSYAVTGNTILAFLKQTEYREKMLSLQKKNKKSELESEINKNGTNNLRTSN